MTAKQYAYVNQEGFVVFEYSGSSPTEFPELTYVEIDFQVGSPPTEYSRFHLSSKTWMDVRSEQQKYDDAVSSVNEQRRGLLYQSDWTQLPNNPLTLAQQNLWATYRQQLRDLPNQEGYPLNIEWPTVPK